MHDGRAGFEDDDDVGVWLRFFTKHGRIERHGSGRRKEASVVLLCGEGSLLGVYHVSEIGL